MITATAALSPVMPMRRTGRVARLFLAAAMLASAPASAETPEEAQKTLRDLYRVALTAEVCHFDLAKPVSDAIGRRMDGLVKASGLSDDDLDAFYARTEADMAAEGWELLCSKDGRWIEEFRALVKQYGN